MQHSAGNSPTNTEPLPNSPKGDNPSDESVDRTILGTPISYKVLELNNSAEGSDDAEKTVAVAMEDNEKEKPLIELFSRKRKASSEMQKKVVSPPKRHPPQLMPQEEGEGSSKRMKGDERSEAVIQGLLDLNQEFEEEKENSEHDYEVQTIVVPFADLMENNEAEPSVEEEGSEVKSYASDEEDEVEPSIEEEEGSEVESHASEDNEVNNPSAENSVENEEEDDEEETTEVNPSAVVVESEGESDHAEKDDEVKLSAVDTNEVVEPCAAGKVEYEEGQPSGANKDEGESSHAAEKKAKGGFKFDLNVLPPEEEDEN